MWKSRQRENELGWIAETYQKGDNFLSTPGLSRRRGLLLRKNLVLPRRPGFGSADRGALGDPGRRDYACHRRGQEVLGDGARLCDGVPS